MAYKDPGPNVSQKPQAVVGGGGQYTAEDHSFESLVFQGNKPFTDWEMNLMQEVLGTSGLGFANRARTPSCWLTGDFLERPDVGGSFSFYAPDPPGAATANRFKVAAATLSVNGWTVRFDLTESATPGINRITLPAPPSGSGTTRTDLVFLEFWRALVSPSGMSNKSPSGQILRHGNAKAPDSSPPGNVNLADDLVDPGYAALAVPIVETTRRIQIQYRYRVVIGVDLKAYPDGLDSPSVVANTVPYLGGSGVDGNATAFPFTKSSSDPGLWTAGTNDAAGVTAAGSADGLVYAIPLCAVLRRNSAAFDRSTNINGGSAMSSGTPTRPDGLYCDQVVDGDVKDLRKSVAFDLHEVMRKAVQQVYDNSMITEHELSSDGPAGTSFLARDDIGTSGHVGNSDGIRVYFSDRSVIQPVVCRADVTGAVTSVNFDLSALKLSWDASAVDVLSLAPAGTAVAGIGRVRIVKPSTTSDKDGLNGISPYVTNVQYSVAVGPGVDFVTLNFDAAITNSKIYVELLIRYPSGSGLKRNVVGLHQVWASTLPVWADTTGFTAVADRRSVPPSLRWISPGHRELSLRLKTLDQTATFYTYATDRLLVWERLTGDPITISDGTNAPYVTTNYQFNVAYTVVTLTGGVSIGSGVAVSVTYKAHRAVPPQGVAPNDSYQVFYQTRAVQSLPVPSGTQTLSLVPRAISAQMAVITNGSGSPDDGFPFEASSAQVPVGQLPSADFPESALDAPNVVSSAGFATDTGFVEFQAIVPYMPNPSQVTLYRDALDVAMDGDGRNFWPKSDSGSIPVYSPVSFTQPLSSKQRHKVVLPTLMELKADFAGIGRRGTLVLVLMTGWYEYDDQNSVVLARVVGASCAAVYRVRGNMMNPRRTDV